MLNIDDLSRSYVDMTDACRERNSSYENQLFDWFCFLSIDLRTSNSVEMKDEPSDDIHVKHEIEDPTDENLPLDLSCSKTKRSSDDNHTENHHSQSAYSSSAVGDQFQELNDLATAAILFNDIKQEPIGRSKNLLDFTSSNLQNILSNAMMPTFNLSTSIAQETSMVNFKEIELSIREKFQHAQPLPIPEGNQSSNESHRSNDIFIDCLFFVIVVVSGQMFSQAGGSFKRPTNYVH
jgi:hypothetical protein